MTESPHSILGVRQGSSKDDIKAAYHRQAKLWHPDINKTAYAAQRFQQVQLAAQSLLDEQEGKWDKVAKNARTWSPSAQQMRSQGFNRMRARAGVPMTLAACGVAIAGGFVMFGIKWSQHEAMYPRRPRSLGPVPQTRAAVELHNDEPAAKEA